MSSDICSLSDCQAPTLSIWSSDGQGVFTTETTSRLSALQVGLFATSLSQPGTWIGSHVFPLPPRIDFARFKTAWSTVVQQNQILRSRITWNDDARGPASGGSANESEGMQLLVLKEEHIPWEEHVLDTEDALAATVKQLRTRSMGLGQRLSAFTILQVRDGAVYFIWTMHHALYDNSHLLVLDDVLRIYHHDDNDAPNPPIRPSFVSAFLEKRLKQVDHQAARAFWAQELSDCEDAAIFPSPSKLASSEHPQTRVETAFSFPAPKRTIISDAGNSTLVRAAWAMVLARHTATSDVVFGCTVAGRYDDETRGLVGPTFATVPVRVKFGVGKSSLAECLGELHAAAARAKVHEQVGLQAIREVNASTKQAASFQNLLVVQPKNHPTPAPVTSATKHLAYHGSDKFEFIKTHLDLTQSYGLVMEVTPSSSGTWLLVAKYDDRLLSAADVHRLCGHFSQAILEVFQEKNRHVAPEDIQLLTADDVAIIQDLFAESSSAVDGGALDTLSPRLLHQAFEERAALDPDSMAVDAWDYALSYGELNAQSTALARHIHHQHRGSCSIIPVCFLKSANAVVAMLAVLKAGCAYLPVDPGWPDDRIGQILERAGQGVGRALPLVLCDEEQKARFAKDSFLRHHQRTTFLAVGRELELETGPNLKSSQGSTSSSPFPSPTSSDPAYIIFTSGSTGIPKGIVMSHGACAANMAARLSRLGSYDSTTRALQFSSFAFDVSVFDIFGTLSAGGSIVIPHESHRMSPPQLSRFMTEKRVNWASVSPSLAELLDPRDVPTLGTLILGGEVLSREVIAKWTGPQTSRRPVRLGNELGPSETCVACVGNYDVTSDTDPRDLGRAVGGNKLYLVAHDDPSRLAPVGCVGELVVWGKSIMSGYFQDAVRTGQVFVDLPAPLQAMLPPSSSHGKAFRTGDLFYLNDKGHLMFVGRKDQQIKLRGFRIETGEIEACLKLEDGVRGAVVELVSLRRHDDGGGSDSPELVVFFCVETRPTSLDHGDGDGDGSDLAKISALLHPSSNPWILTVIQRMQSRVHAALPHYMAPSLYVPITHIPMTRSGKQDRKHLRFLLESAIPPLLQELYDASHSNDSSTGGQGNTADDNAWSLAEQDLKRLWAKVLGIHDTSSIRRDSNFFHLGGNSIKAIRLSQLANRNGFPALDTVGIYEHATLRQMAALGSWSADSESSTAPTTPQTATSDSLADKISTEDKESSSNESRKRRICHSLRLTPKDVDGLYPCTPLQEGLLATAIRQPGTYVVSRIWRLGTNINVDVFRQAWDLSIQRHEILRTVITQDDDDRFWQVVFAHGVLEDMGFANEERPIRGLDLPAEKKQAVQRLRYDQTQGKSRLSFFEILADLSAGTRYFKWTIHHALYDAEVLAMVWADVRQHYESLTRLRRDPTSLQEQPQPDSSFGDFVRATYSSDLPPTSRAFWETYLSSSEPWPTFPAISRGANGGHLGQTDSVKSRHLDLAIHTPPGITEASLIRAAWAWVQARYLGVDDVVFGVTLSGRSYPGATTVVGPTITTVPVRVRAAHDMSIADFLGRVQGEANAMMRHERAGVARIKALGDSARWACDFANVLVVQDSRGRKSGVADWEGVDAVSADTDIRHSIPLVLECALEEGGGLAIHAVFNSQFLAPDQVDFLLAHLGKAVESLSMACALAQAQASRAEAPVLLGDIEFLCPRDEAWYKTSNQKEMPCANRLIHSVFEETAERVGAQTAIDAWDVQFTYAQLHRASDVVARKLVRDHGVGPGVLVAISFEKSGWAVTAMLSILKAGGGFVPLDLNHPGSRLKDILTSTKAVTALCSASRVQQLQHLMGGAAAVLPLDQESLAQMEKASSGEPGQVTTNVTPRDICYVLFTSGSTGRPKGVVLEHASVCTSLLGHASPMNLAATSRVLQFAAYTFDTAIGEIFTTLLVGATLCVPSDQQRINALADFINANAVTWLWLTPTVAGLLDPRAVPAVSTVVMGGEPASAKLFRAWTEQGTCAVVYGYGPTEASITVTLDVAVTADTDPANIGRPICARTWVVDPRDHERLLPVGCVGELVVSGPTVGRGYLDHVGKTRLAFGEIPDTWERLLKGPGDAAEKDDKMQRERERERFYKTGDIVRYDVTGNIIFVGRKDDQIKLHGQRIELPEIAKQMDQILGHGCFSIVEKIVLETSGDNSADPDDDNETNKALLVAFFTLAATSKSTGQNGDTQQHHHHHHHHDPEDGLSFIQRPSPTETRAINDLSTNLSALLPRSMIPSVFLPLRAIPLTTSGKVDRAKLRKEALQITTTSAGLGEFMPDRDRDKEQPRNATETQLRALWCAILRLSPADVGIRDSFLRLGGDSLRAVALVNAARRAGLQLSVADVFSHAVLADMAQVVGYVAGTAVADDQRGFDISSHGAAACAFHLLDKQIDTDAIRIHAAGQCGTTADDIEDIYPCTAMQVGMIVASALSPETKSQQEAEGPRLYELRRRIIFECASSAHDFSAAWAAVCRTTPVLRTRIVQYESAFYQVVLREETAPCVSASDASARARSDILGAPLAELSTGPDSNVCDIFLHHCIYDAGLLPILLEHLRQHYLQLASGLPGAANVPSPQRRIPFRDFIHHLQSCDKQAAMSFWSHYLEPQGSKDKIALGTWPPQQQHMQLAGAEKTSDLKRYFDGPPIENKTTTAGITLANVIYSAWAVVVARHTGVQEVTFGTTLSGRDLLEDDGLVEGPTLTTVPLRFRVVGDHAVTELLHTAQRDAVEIKRHQHLGMSNIAKAAGGAGNCAFRTLLVVQTPVDNDNDAVPGGDTDIISSALQNLPGLARFAGEDQVAKQEYPLVLECMVTSTRLTGVRAYYDGLVVEKCHVELLLAHFEQAIRTLVDVGNGSRLEHLKTHDVDLVTAVDVARLSEWNANPPEPSRQTLLGLFLDKARESPNGRAVYSTDRCFSYGELDRYSTLAARYISERMGPSPSPSPSTAKSKSKSPPPFAVAVCYEKSVWAVVAILAIMKLGAAYVPLDPSSPDSRLAMILDDVEATSIVCSPKQAARFANRAANSTCSIIQYDGQNHDENDDDDNNRPHNNPSSSSNHPPLTASSLAYILYTSGSTGKPKGVLVPHRAICTSILAWSPIVQLTSTSRVLQFSSFGFDASVGELFATLAAGGCICLPSDEERLADVAAFIAAANVTWAFLTPVTLRVIAAAPPHDDDMLLPSLKVLVVGGEPLPPSLFRRWAGHRGLRLMEAYGPTECCVFSTVNTAVTPDTHPQDIGARLGGAVWMVDPDDYHRLAPVGCVGELVVSGATLAAGYHNLPLAGGFVEETPRWAAQFPGHDLRRIYRSGDLARFKSDGSVHYVGRKDNQVHLRGMRMELGEIEYHLARSAAGDKAAPIVVMTEISTGGVVGVGDEAEKKHVLACFFVTEVGGSGMRPEALRMTKQRRATVESIVAHLEGKVPPYMIPTMFIPLPCFPVNTSGKVERKILVEDILGEFQQQDYMHYTVSSAINSESPQRGEETVTMTDNERLLRQIWAALLDIDASTIKPHDNLLRLGGDSVDIIRLVSTLRQQGLHLSPLKAMADPKLSSMASNITFLPNKNTSSNAQQEAQAGTGTGTRPPVQGAQQAPAGPFPLLQRQVGAAGAEKLAMLAAKQCGTRRDTILDMYPSTALQEGLLAVSETSPGAYWYRQAWTLETGIDSGRFVAAYRALCQAHPILRTRLVRGEDGRCYQVVLDDDDDEIPVVRHVDNGSNQVNEPATGSLMGKPLHAAELCGRIFKRSIHHALYDAWSLTNLDAELAARYEGGAGFSPPKTLPYTQFIEHITQQQEDSTVADTYWKSYLDGARQTCWPAVPDNHQPRTTACVHKTFALQRHNDKTSARSSTSIQDHTKSAVARLAWAVLLSKYANETDVTFGVALSGRDTPIAGIEAMTGPTNATIPVRYQLDASDGGSSPPTASIISLLEAARNEAAEASTFQHHGLQNMMRTSAGARNACNFRSLLVVQPAQQLQQHRVNTTVLFQQQQATTAATGPSLHPHPILVELCFDNHHGRVDMWVHYDEQLLSGPQVDLIAAQFHMTLRALVSADPSASIDAALHHHLQDQVSPMLMKRFHNDTTLSAAAAATEPSDIVSLVAAQVALHPDAPAISTWDGDMTYRELDATATVLSTHLQHTHDLQAGSLVAICFEKSVWAVVAMLAVMKADCAYVPLDPSAPDTYKKVQLDQVVAAQGHSRVFLASETHVASLRSLVTDPTIQVLAVAESTMQHLARSSSSQPPANNKTRPHRNSASPTAAAYVLFTSGSTGAPKGVVMPHHAASASILAHGAACHFGPSTRALQFAAFTFDASIMELWTTLAFGGCVCMPSDAQRLDGLERYMADARVSWAFLTPTVSGLVRREAVERTLRTLVLGGEALRRGDVEKWTVTSSAKTTTTTGEEHHLMGGDGDGAQHCPLELMNGYGPTECCVFTCVNTHLTPTTDPQDVGRAIGVSAWIVDPNDHHRLMPLTWPGELVITGPALAREYLGDTVKTARAFVHPHWTTALLGAKTRAYRTGDLAAMGIDGHVRILGRLDGQIKLRGRRLEAGEIEQALCACAADMVALQHRVEALVCKAAPEEQDSIGGVRGEEEAAEAGVVAFLRFGRSSSALPPGEENDMAAFAKELAKRMAARVPHYMIPSSIVPVSEFPVTVAGKVDRKALSKLAGHLQDGTALPSFVLGVPVPLILSQSSTQIHGSGTETAADLDQAPASRREMLLRDLWAAVLPSIQDASLVTRHDDFFGLGGDSIRAIRLVSMARERHRLSLTVSDIFRHPWLADMADRMSEVVEAVVEDQPFDMLLDDD